MLGDYAKVVLIDAEHLEADSVNWSSYDLLLVLTSTYGSGVPPDSATKCAVGTPQQAPCRSSLTSKHVWVCSVVWDSRDCCGVGRQVMALCKGRP